MNFLLPAAIVIAHAAPTEPASDRLYAEAAAHYSANELDKAAPLAGRALAQQEAALAPTDAGLIPYLELHGLILNGLRDYDAAVVSLERCLHMREAELGARHEYVAHSLMTLVPAYRSLGRRSEATATANLALSILEETGAPDLAVAQAANLVAGLQKVDGDLDGALANFERALHIIGNELGTDSHDYGIVMSNLGGLRTARGEYEAAKLLFEEVVKIMERHVEPDDISMASLLGQLGFLALETGDYPTSLEMAERNFEIIEAHFGPDHPRVAKSLANLGALHRTMGDLESAISLIERSVEINRRRLGKEHPARSHGLGGLGMAYVDLGQYEIGMRHISEALDIDRANFGDDHIEIATSLGLLAVANRRRGHYRRARPLYEQVLALREKHHGPDHPDVAQACNNLAVLLRAQGDNDGAHIYYERSLAIARKTLGPEHPIVAQYLNNSAAVLEGQGRLEEALSRHRESLAIREKVAGPPNVALAESYSSLARVFRTQGDPDAALPHYLRSMAILEDALGSNHPYIAANLNNIGLTLKELGDLGEARTHMERGLVMSTDTSGPHHPDTAVFAKDLANVLMELGERDAARSLFAQSLAAREARFDLVEVLSEREALAFGRSVRNAFNGWLRAFNRPEDAQEAWSTMLRWKGAMTRRLRARATMARSHDGEIAELRDALNRKRLALAALATSPYDSNTAAVRRETAVRLANEKEVLEREIGKQSAEWSAEHHARKATAADVCAALPQNTGLVDYFRYYDAGSTYLAFVVVAPACEVVRVEIGPAKELEKGIQEWRETLADMDSLPSRINRRGRKVAEQVWDPIAPLLGEVDRIIIIPDRSLSAVPFSALPRADGRFLLETHTVSYLTDAQDLLRHKATAGKGALIVGDVAYGNTTRSRPESQLASRAAKCRDGRYGPLEHTGAEASQVAANWAKSRHRHETVELLSGSDASENTVIAETGDKRLIHLATHGFFATENCQPYGEDSALDVIIRDPMLLSGLVLAGANEPDLADGDGILTAEEISTLDLRGIELVVLSACETGLGEVTSGEGVLGLQRGFAVAGAQQLVMSLWSVPDDSTAALMDHFYGDLLRKRRPTGAAESLRAAQLSRLEYHRAINGDSRPGEWAAFIVSGSDR